MITMTFEKFDHITELQSKIRSKTLWPDERQIQMMEENPKRWLEFACYLYEYGTPPATQEEAENKKKLAAFIHRNLTLK